MAGIQGNRRRAVHGVMLIDKPRGCTSQAALQKVRRALYAEKAGHTGTLDPLAEGLLPLCFGAATKFAQLHLDADKAYRAVVQLGVATSTDDAEGEVVARQPVPALSVDHVQDVLQKFIGVIAQTPPIYSALKREGKPLYAYARAGETIEVRPRQVRIDGIDLISIEADRLTLDVRCGKGTYIRALARDIGQQLGCGAHLGGLRRTVSGGFNVEHAQGLDVVVDAEDAGKWLLPVDCLVAGLPRIDLDASQTSRILQGQRLPFGAQADLATGDVRVYGCADGRAPLFLGVAKWDGQLLAAQRLLSNEELLAQ